jgi:hypothetical protein
MTFPLPNDKSKKITMIIYFIAFASVILSHIVNADVQECLLYLQDEYDYHRDLILLYSVILLVPPMTLVTPYKIYYHAKANKILHWALKITIQAHQISANHKPTPELQQLINDLKQRNPDISDKQVKEAIKAMANNNHGICYQYSDSSLVTYKQHLKKLRKKFLTNIIYKKIIKKYHRDKIITVDAEISSEDSETIGI